MLNALGWLTGPIFTKEMLEVARRKRYYFNRLLYGSCLLLALFLVWEAEVRYGGSGATLPRQRLSRLAESLFDAVSIVQYAAVFVFVPMFLSGAICGERERGTLDLLFTTHLTDRQIVLGKLGSRLVILGLLILSGLPVLSLLMLFGGVGPLALAEVFFLTLVATLFTAAHSIYFSVATKNPIASLVRTYWWLLCELIILPYLAGAVLHEVTDALTHSWPVRQGAMDFYIALLYFADPLVPFLSVQVPEMSRELDRALTALGVPAPFDDVLPFCHFVVPALFSFFLIWRATRRLRKEPTSSWLWLVAGRLFQPMRALWEALGRPLDELQLLLPNDRHSFRHLKVANPLWQRARLTRVYDREGHIRRIQWAGWGLALFTLVLVAVMEPRAFRHGDLSIPFVCLAWLGVLVLTAIFAGASVMGDRGRGFLDQMLVTPLTAQEIVDGTLLAVWQHVRLTWLLACALTIFFVLIGAATPHGALFSFITASLFCSVVAIHGVLCSLAARTMPGALVPAFVFPLVILIGPVSLAEYFRRDHGLILWVLAAGLLLVGLVWTALCLRGRLQLGPAAACCWFTGISFALICLATFYIPGRDQPAEVMNPAFWTGVLLDEHLRLGYEFGNLWLTILAAFWLVLFASFIWARWWMIRHFDRLVGREDRGRAG